MSERGITVERHGVSGNCGAIFAASERSPFDGLDVGDELTSESAIGAAPGRGAPSRFEGRVDGRAREEISKGWLWGPSSVVTAGASD